MRKVYLPTVSITNKEERRAEREFARPGGSQSQRERTTAPPKPERRPYRPVLVGVPAARRCSGVGKKGNVEKESTETSKHGQGVFVSI